MKCKNIFAAIFFLTSNFLLSQEGNQFSFAWDNGFKLESADKNFKLKFGGRLMIDHAFFSQDAGLDDAFGQLLTKNGTEFRRARFFFSGTVYENVTFKLNIDFASGNTVLKDAYIGIKNIPFVGNIRVGHVKEPFRLDALTSSKYLTFMEPALLTDFTPIRNNGILLFNNFLDKRLSVQTGLFRNASGRTGNDLTANDGFTFTGRMSGLPFDDNEKKLLLHVGLGYTYKKPNDKKEFKIASRPEAHLSGKKYLNTGIIEDVENVQMANFETALVKGPFSVQAEYLIANINTGTGITSISYNFSSYYAQTSYFITGEYKRFKSSYSGFNRLKPTHNFVGKNKGAGAWEVALRYSNSDLNNKDIFGGEQRDITLGLNWYLNPVTRIMFNHVWEKVKNFGNATAFQVRFQIDF
ncbi:MAG TPA: hypothetical protein ENK46_14550 [Flavobacteriia bacterium]|nr:hypothetical protein [Flavobacteriia bacterium]